MRKTFIKRIRSMLILQLKYIPMILLTALVSSGITLGIMQASAHGGDTNKVHSCVKNNFPNMPNVRIVGENVNCNSNETALDWPKSIPTGMLSDDEVLWHTETVSDNQLVSVNCPAGKVALGGGGGLNGGSWVTTSNPIGPTVNAPPLPDIGDGSTTTGATGWEVAMANGSGPVSVWVICAKVN